MVNFKTSFPVDSLDRNSAWINPLSSAECEQFSRVNRSCGGYDVDQYDFLHWKAKEGTSAEEEKGGGGAGGEGGSPTFSEYTSNPRQLLATVGSG